MPRLTSLIPALRKGALERLAKSHDWRVAGIVEAMLLPPGTTSKELREAVALLHKETLYNFADGRALSGMDKSPPTHAWVDDRTHLMGVSTYISGIKTRLWVASTKL